MIVNTIFNPSNILVTNNSYREITNKNSENIYLFNKKQQTNIVALNITVSSLGFNPPIFVNQTLNNLYYDPSYNPASFQKITLKINRSISTDWTLKINVLPSAPVYPGVMNIQPVLVIENFTSISTYPVRNYYFNAITDANIQSYNNDISLNSIYPGNEYIPDDPFHTFSVYIIDNFTPAQKTWIQDNLIIERSGFIRQF